MRERGDELRVGQLAIRQFRLRETGNVADPAIGPYWKLWSDFEADRSTSPLTQFVDQLRMGLGAVKL